MAIASREGVSFRQMIGGEQFFYGAELVTSGTETRAYSLVTGAALSTTLTGRAKVTSTGTIEYMTQVAGNRAR